MEEIEFALDVANESMGKAVQFVQKELAKIRAGKAMPAMLDGILIDYYGTQSPINQVASINTSDAKTLVIKPYEKNLINEIEKAIINSDLGLNPQNNGDIIRIIIPPLTEERRRDLVRQIRHEVENGKISIRNVRKECNDELKKLLKDGASEDEIKNAEEKVQGLTNKHIKKVDELLSAKENEVMTI